VNRLQRCVKSYDHKMKHPPGQTISTQPVGQTGFCTSVPVCSKCFQVRIHRTSLLSKVIVIAFPQNYPLSFVLTRCTMLSFCHTTPTEAVLFSYLSSGWATITGRFLGLKVGNSIKCLSQGYSDALPHRDSNQRFASFPLPARRFP